MNEWSKFAVPDLSADHRPDGSLILRCAEPLGPVERSIGAVLLRHARDIPDRPHIAQRDVAGGWRNVTYAQSAAAARSIGQALLRRGLGPERPVVMIGENTIEQALLGLGAALVGVPFAPVSAAYARPGQGFIKLRHILGLVKPGLIFVDTWRRYADACEAFDETGAEIVVADGAPPDAAATPFSALAATQAGAAVDEAADAVRPDTIVKILFTSGSTGEPKGVINTQQMICANQAQIAAGWHFVKKTPPVLLEWLPWSHTFAGNHDFYLVMWWGGTYYIDDGKPAPGLIEKTMANLRDLSPTMYLNVPRGYALMVPFLERDAGLRDKFFSRLDFVFYAGAAMEESLQERIRALARQATGQPVPLISSWGATETAPFVTARFFPTSHPSNIGVPGPGMELKLAPVGDKQELRVRGPNVFKGYWRRPDATQAAFDEEGFYRSGDAGRLLDPADPRQGVLFDGRITENFKLSSGTWVHVGNLRLALVSACAPVAEDVVIAGQDRDEITAMVFPSLAGCRSLCPHLPDGATAADLAAQPAVRRALSEGLARLNRGGGGSSRQVVRAVFVTDPARLDTGEITDKGYLNQRAILAQRGAVVERLYAAIPDPDIVTPAAETATS